MANMKSKDFISKAVDIAKNYNTLYVMGCFGAPLTGSNVNRYCNNHSYNKDAKRTAMIKAVADKNPPYYGFDCVNLIKSILWGWCGDKSKTYGGATYNSNGVPDTNADGMIQKCTNVSTNFTNIIPGEAVWMTGHIGIYIGDGLVVEATPQWTNDVQFTALGNIGTKSGYNTRKWTKHGKLPYVDYSDYTVTSTKPTTSTTVNTSNSSYYPKYIGNSVSLDAILKAIGVPTQYTGSYTNRKPLAVANGISNYSGTSAQNSSLKTLAKEGKLKKVGLSTNTTTTPAVKYFKKYTGTSGSIVSALKAVGAESSYTYRLKIAKANNISLYVGTAKQNTTMVNLLKQGKLIMP